jgi:uncharacterized protein YutE (UPF0331/DUF86 family)
VPERDVLLAKAATIDRCIARIEEVRARLQGLTALDRSEIVLLNLQRAAQAAIDLAAHVVSEEELPLPAETRDLFTTLASAGVVDASLTEAMRRMVGFRNLAVHEYREIDARIVEAIVSQHLGELRAFAGVLLDRYGAGQRRAGTE